MFVRSNFLHSPDLGEAEWCYSFPPLAYSHVQDKYWDVSNSNLSCLGKGSAWKGKSLMVWRCTENRGGYTAGSCGETRGGRKETSWWTEESMENVYTGRLGTDGI